MKLTILQEKLKKGLNIIEKISPKSLTLPILSNVLVSTEKNFLNLSATDLEIGINLWILTKIEKQGQIAVPSKLFSNFVNLLPNERIDIQQEENSLNIKCKNYKTKIKGFSAEEFPIIPKIIDGEFIVINSLLFCNAINRVVDIAVPSTTKPEISGVYFLFQKNLITIVATDSFRLGEKRIFLKNAFSLKNDYALIIPQKAAKEIVNILEEKNKDLKIYFSPNQIMFETFMEETNHPETRITSRIIEGEYPNYKEIIPQKFTTSVVFNKNELLNQIKSAALFSGRINEIKIKIQPKEKNIEISSESPETGSYSSSISGEIKGKEIEVSFNYRFLLDGILNIKSSEVLFELNQDEKNEDVGPGVLRPVGDNSYLYVVMPIKTNLNSE
jgi:DNA polymerase III subunit beta